MSSSTPSTSNSNLLTSSLVVVNPFTFSTGDTKILVTYKGNKIEGLVSSHALCMASPVWKKFIYPPWGAQGAGGENGAGVKSIDCSDDDGDALLVLMNIVHIEFQKVPDSLDCRVLQHVALLCEQYQCVRIVAPWVGGWMQCGYGTIDYSEFWFGWLYIYLEFGDEQKFEYLAVELTKCLRYNEEGVLTDHKGTPLEDTLPDGIIGMDSSLVS